MAPVIMGAPGQPELSEELTNSFCRTDPEIVKHFARVTFLPDVRAAVPRLLTPTLILQCDDVLMAPTTVGNYLHRVLPRSTLSIVKNVATALTLVRPVQPLPPSTLFLHHKANRCRQTPERLRKRKTRWMTLRGPHADD